MTDDARLPQTDHDPTERRPATRPGSYLADLQRQTAEVARAAGLAPTPEAVDRWRPECGRQVPREDRLPWLVGFLSGQLELIVEAYAAGDDDALRRTLTGGLAVVEASR